MGAESFSINYSGDGVCLGRPVTVNATQPLEDLIVSIQFRLPRSEGEHANTGNELTKTFL